MLIDNIEECIHIIDRVTESVACERMDEVGQLMPVLSKALQTVIPPIVSSYLREEMAQVREDMQYWITQLERIMSAIEGNDLFSMVDVLHFETRENLILYKDMIQRAGLSEEL